MGLFREDAAARRRLVLLLYGIVGPVFTAVLVATAAADARTWAPATVALLIAAGAAWLALRPVSRSGEWVFPAAVVPTICCGIAAYASGVQGPAYFGVMGAPIAWVAVLFEAPVVWSALVTAVGTCLVTVTLRAGALAGVLNTIVLGTILGLVGWVVHRQAEALRHARSEVVVAAERDRALIEALPDTVAVADAAGKFLDLHAPSKDALQLPASEMVGRSVFEFLPPEVVPRMRAALGRALETGALTTVEYTVQYRGAPQNVEARIARSLAGEVVVIRRDVTERERAAEERRLLAGLVRGMAEAVIVADAELRIIEYTGRAEEIYGWKREEVLGKSLVRDFTSEVEGEEEVRRALQEGRDVRSRLRALRKDGDWIDLELSATALRDPSGHLTAWLSVVRDIRETIARERALQESEELLRQSERSLQGTVADLQNALQQVRRLSGLLPICMHCHKIRDDSGYWARVEAFISERSEAQFTHALCPECMQKYYGPLG